MFRRNDNLADVTLDILILLQIDFIIPRLVVVELEHQEEEGIPMLIEEFFIYNLVGNLLILFSLFNKCFMVPVDFPLGFISDVAFLKEYQESLNFVQ